MLQEKNVPTDPKKWAKWIAQAKKKFDVYPSAYANGWAAKMYKKDGGGWKTMKESIMERYVEKLYDISSLEETTAYQQFFEKMLKKYGVKSPQELDDETKKKFYNEIENGWTAKDESIYEETLLQAIDEGFTPEQIKKLQQEYGKIKRVDPTSPAMQKMTKLVTSMSDEDLEVLCQAKIPFVSGIAVSEKVRRKFQQ